PAEVDPLRSRLGRPHARQARHRARRDRGDDHDIAAARARPLPDRIRSRRRTSRLVRAARVEAGADYGVYMNDDLRLALALADAADAITMRSFQSTFTVRTKADRTPVTEVDEAVERAIREM